MYKEYIAYLVLYIYIYINIYFYIYIGITFPLINLHLTFLTFSTEQI